MCKYNDYIDKEEYKLNPSYMIADQIKVKLSKLTVLVKKGQVVFRDYLPTDISSIIYCNYFLHEMLEVYINSMQPDFESFVILVDLFLISRVGYEKYPEYLRIIYDHFSLCDINDLERILENGELK